jgi:heme-degrading monooxygenase HmoA
MSFLRVWEYQVRPGCSAEFEELFAADGPWARLFAEAEGHLRLQAASDADREHRFLILDWWRSADEHARAKSSNAEAYSELDVRTRALCEHEARLGGFCVDGD